MKSVIAYVASAALFAASALAQSPPMVNTPANSTVCRPLVINWAGGTAPYFLSILPGGQPSAPPLVDFGQVSGNSLTWVVNVTNGELGINLRDSTGLLAQSAIFPNLPGTSNACLKAAPPPPAGPTSGGSDTSTPPPAGPTSGGSDTSTPPVSVGPPLTSTPPDIAPATISNRTTIGPSAPTPSNSTGAAPTVSAQVWFAGALAFAIGALFA